MDEAQKRQLLQMHFFTQEQNKYVQLHLISVKQGCALDKTLVDL